MKIPHCVLIVLALLLPTGISLSAPLPVRNVPGDVVGAVGTYLPVVARSPHDTWVGLCCIKVNHAAGCSCSIKGTANGRGRRKPTASRG